MESPCPHCDQPDLSLLRLVLISELLCADETLLLRLAAVMQQCGLLQISPEPDTPASALVQTRKVTLKYLQQPGALHQKSGQYADPSVNKTFLASF